MAAYTLGDVAAHVKQKKATGTCKKFLKLFESRPIESLKPADQEIEDTNGKSITKRKVVDHAVSQTAVNEDLKKIKKRKRVSDDDEEIVKKRKKKKPRIEDPEEDARTVFVGNVPVNTEKKELRDLFKPYGKIESLRFRSVPTPDLQIPKKVAAILKNFNENRHNMNAFVKFASAESAQNAIELNGSEVNGFKIRVDVASNNRNHDHKRSIFVGNLPFDVEENNLYEHFSEYGEIDSVRIIRDKVTSIGKGFGFVLFKSADSVNLALKFVAKPFNGRTLRVKRSVTEGKLKEKKNNKPVNAGPTSSFMRRKKTIKDNSTVSFQGETAKFKNNKKTKKRRKFKSKKM